MVIPEGFILSLFVFVLFIVFSITQIKKGRDDIKNIRGTGWLNRLRVLFALILLIWFLILICVLMMTALNFIPQN
jgi:hypothetical protein